VQVFSQKTRLNQYSIMTNLKFLSCFLSFVLVLPALSHGRQDKSTVLNANFLGFKGELRIQFQPSDTVKSGTFSFITTRPKKEIQDDDVVIKDLTVNGKYEQDEPNERWNFRFGKYHLNEINIKKSNSVFANFKLNGFEEDYGMQFRNGSLNGRAFLRKRILANGKQSALFPVMTLNFENDTLKGSFEYEDDFIKISGQTNEEGFWDGKIIFEYRQDSTEIRETRQYSDGFLLHLEKTDKVHNRKIFEAEFSDVKSKLFFEGENRNFKISDDYFGVNFNFGYPETNKKILAQSRGNELFVQMTGKIETLAKSVRNGDKRRIVLKLTRRFEFIYPDYEDSILNRLPARLSLLRNEISDFLKRPNLQLRKNNSMTVFREYKRTEHLITKINAVETVLNDIQQGFFKLNFRDSYYHSGVQGLNQSDTLVVNLREKKDSLIFTLKNEIKTADSLVYRLMRTVADLQDIFVLQKNKITQTLSIFENQEVIDSIDVKISEFQKIIQDAFITPENIDHDKLNLTDKVYLSINERLLQPLKSQYFSKNLSQSNAIQIGEKILCLMSFLVGNRLKLEEASAFQKHWNDSLFTVYADNPFDYRRTESRILNHTQTAANILFKHYATQLLNAKTCQQLSEELNKMLKLNKRVHFLVNNKDNPNVQQLDKALRGESVFNRIERILELI
jgi:hypothetical protein